MSKMYRQIVSILLTVFLFAGLADADHVKLFVLTGQSNSLGTTAGKEDDPSPGSDPADKHIIFYWSNVADAVKSIGSSSGLTDLREQQGGHYPGSATHWGPEISFARTLYRAGVRNFGVIKASRGGGGNSFWLKSSKDHHMYSHVTNTVAKAAAELRKAGHTFEIVGLLYLQGESDNASEAEEAGSRVKTLVDNLRKDLPNAKKLYAVIGGIAAQNQTRDIVRARQEAIADKTGYIDYFNNVDLRSRLYDSLHFDKEAKITVGQRFAMAFFSAGVVSRHYGKFMFIGDSITQGGNGDHPGYRYRVFAHLAENSVPASAERGYEFCGSVKGGYNNSVMTTPNVKGQTFRNIHDGHYGWRASWIAGRIPLPAGRYNTRNLGNGTLMNWIGQTNAFVTADSGTLVYNGSKCVPDTASIMIGINDIADGVEEKRVRDDTGIMIDQLRSVNPDIRVHLCRVLHTNQGAERNAKVDKLNIMLSELVKEKNTASDTSPVWLVNADEGFDPVKHTYDKVHPNVEGEKIVGDHIAVSLGLIAGK